MLGLHYTKVSKGVRKRLFSVRKTNFRLVLDVEDDFEHGLT